MAVSPVLPWVAQDTVWESSVAKSAKPWVVPAHHHQRDWSWHRAQPQEADIHPREMSGAGAHRGQRFQGAAYIHRPLLGEKLEPRLSGERELFGAGRFPSLCSLLLLCSVGRVTSPTPFLFPLTAFLEGERGTSGEPQMGLKKDHPYLPVEKG